MQLILLIFTTKSHITHFFGHIYVCVSNTNFFIIIMNFLFNIYISKYFGMAHNYKNDFNLFVIIQSLDLVCIQVLSLGKKGKKPRKQEVEDFLPLTPRSRSPRSPTKNQLFAMITEVKANHEELKVLRHH
jgi:hypothetical protein